MKKLVIIPAFNEAGSIEALVKKIKKVVIDFDVIIINDCSTDETLKVCKKIGVKVLDLPFNLGIGGAVQAGYRYAYQNNYDIAVQVDGDGQHNPIFLDALTKEIENGYDMVIGSRFLEGKGFQSTLIRRIGIDFFSYLIKFITQNEVTDPTSGFRACNKNLIAYFALNYPKDYPEPETIVCAYRLNMKVKEVPVVMNSRESGISSINHLKSIYYMVKVTLAILIDSLKRENKFMKEE